MELRSDIYNMMITLLPDELMVDYIPLETVMLKLGVTGFTDSLEDVLDASVASMTLKDDIKQSYVQHVISSAVGLMRSVDIDLNEDEDITYKDAVAIIYLIDSIITTYGIIEYVERMDSMETTYLEVMVQYSDTYIGNFQSSRLYDIIIDNDSMKPFIRMMYNAHKFNMDYSTVTDISLEMKLSKLELSLSILANYDSDIVLGLIRKQLEDNVKPEDLIDIFNVITSKDDIITLSTYIVLYTIIVLGKGKDGVLSLIKDIIDIDIYIELVELVRNV